MKNGLRAIASVTVLSAVMVLGSSVTASARPAPSVTITMVCAKGVPRTNDLSLRGIYNLQFFDAGNALVGSGSFMECPTDTNGVSTGGRIKQNVTLTGVAASGLFACWNGGIQVPGGQNGPLPLKGTCNDNVDNGGNYATVTVR